METAIPLRKKYLVSGIIGSLVIGSVSLWVFLKVAPSISMPFNIIVQVLMGILVVITIPNAIMGMRKLFSHSIGFIIAPDGITDKTVTTSVNTFSWNEIKEFRMETIGPAQVPVIAIDLVDPEIYMHGVTGVRKKMLQAHINDFGTPVVIRPTLLDIDPNALLQLLITQLHAVTSKATFV